MSHIGPLTNNPAEAKRLQVIRPDQNAPLAQKLGPKMDQYLTGKSRRNKKKRNRNNDKKKTNQRRDKNKNIHKKEKGSNSDTKILSFNNRESLVYQNKITKKVRRILCYFTIWLRIFFVNSCLNCFCYISSEEWKSQNQRLGNNKTSS